jgi:hypothetical protein
MPMGRVTQIRRIVTIILAYVVMKWEGDYMETNGKRVEYTLHGLLYSVDLLAGVSLTPSGLAEFQGVSRVTWRKYSPITGCRFSA